jgi:hypothetical protein
MPEPNYGRRSTDEPWPSKDPARLAQQLAWASEDAKRLGQNIWAALFEAGAHAIDGLIMPPERRTELGAKG